MPNYKVVVLRENDGLAEFCDFVLEADTAETLQSEMNNVETLPAFEKVDEGEEQVLVFETPEPSTHKITNGEVVQK